MSELDRVSGLNGALPTIYDPGWQRFTDLSPAQIAAFQAFPQDLTKYISQLRWQTEIAAFPRQWGRGSYITIPTSVNNPSISGAQLVTDVISQQKIAGLKQAIDNGTLTIVGATFPFLAVNGILMLSTGDITALYGYVVRYVQATYTTAALLLSGANATPQTITNRSQVDSAFQAITVI